MFRILFSLALLAVVVAFATKPDPDQVEQLFREKVQSAIATQNTAKTINPAAKTALALCKLDANACFQLIRAGTDLKYSDKWLYARIDLAGFGKTATCYGLFTRLMCTGDIFSS